MSTVPPELPRVLHFVTGGFSGATQVAVDLVRAHGESGLFDSLLVLRRKRQTDPVRIAALRAQGLAVEVVPGWSHAATIWQLVRLCRKFRPDLLVAHGFSEHLWGRYAGLIARVPRLVQVEHNSRERYTRWRQAQMLWLARRTQAIVGVSQGVREALLARGVDPSKTLAIPNGVRLEPYAQADEHPLLMREPGIVMAARFARQKDHASLLHALALLRQRGRTPRCCLRVAERPAPFGRPKICAASSVCSRRFDFSALQRRPRPAHVAAGVRAVHPLRRHAAVADRRHGRRLRGGGQPGARGARGAAA
jgi:glycosyltransferase involved in cell wall biosynthesis